MVCFEHAHASHPGLFSHARAAPIEHAEARVQGLERWCWGEEGLGRRGFRGRRVGGGEVGEEGLGGGEFGGRRGGGTSVVARSFMACSQARFDASWA